MPKFKVYYEQTRYSYNLYIYALSGLTQMPQGTRHANDRYSTSHDINLQKMTCTMTPRRTFKCYVIKILWKGEGDAFEMLGMPPFLA